jgi:hypothetical protein
MPWRTFRNRSPMRAFPLIALIAAFVLLPSTVSSEVASGTPPAIPENAEIPSTPVGTQLEWVLASIDAPDSVAEDDVESRLTESFLQQISPTAFQQTMQQLADQAGPLSFIGFTDEPTEIEAQALLEGRDGEQFLLDITVQDEPPHLIDFLLIEPAPEGVATEPIATPAALTSWSEFEEELQGFASQFSFLLAELDDGACQPIYAVNPDERLAIGSTFKLYVLGELARQIEAGEVAWDDEILIEDELRSLPPGNLTYEPAGASFTAQQVAEEMIAISDNTATDHLIDLLGRERVEAVQDEMGHGEPSINTPFLTTREAFALKLAATPTQLTAYEEATAEERQRILAEEIRSLDVSEDDAVDWTEPRMIETVEWFASVDELCRAMAFLDDVSTGPGLEPVAAIMASAPDKFISSEPWTSIGFKAGGEVGVLNLSWLLQSPEGRTFVLSLTLNDADRPIDEHGVMQTLERAEELLANLAQSR